VLWARANADARTIVTINKGDFTRLAKNSIFHPGLLIIPSGGSRMEQLDDGRGLGHDAELSRVGIRKSLHRGVGHA
jgi:hypothetical protein